MNKKPALIPAAFVAMLLIALASPVAAESSVTDLPVEDGGSQRVLYAAPENPRAALIMLPGGNGMVEIGSDGSIRRMGESFLLRTLSLWQAQGFAVVVITPPNGMSLLGYRHTPAYAAAHRPGGRFRPQPGGCPGVARWHQPRRDRRGRRRG